MAAKALILAHNNKFNKSVIEENAFYFLNSNELATLLNDNTILNQKKEFVRRNLIKIDKIYRWSVVINQYETYLEKIVKKVTQ